jgi:glycosyltransferase involved in cell wall biosynthesis
MKVAYISYSWFADVDLSFVSKMKDKVDLYYFIIVTQNSLKATAINIKKQYPVSGIFKADIYSEIKQFSSLYDFEKTFIVNLYGKRLSLSNFMSIIRLLFLLVNLRIDVLHTTAPYSLNCLLLYLFRRKTLLTVHDPMSHSSDKSIKSSICRGIAFLLLKNFMLLNRSQKDEFIRFYKLKKKNIFISRLGIYDYLHRYLNNTDKPNQEEYILFFGRIEAYKGLDYLFPAMKMVHNNVKKIKLKVAGYCNKYYFDISEYENCGYIEIMNRFIPDDELAVLIKNALFVVCPYTDATQSGVVMSSFAFDIPVLATNVGGLTEYVEHLKSGFIVQPKDINSLARGIIYLLEHREKLFEQKNYITIKYRNNHYSWDKITDDIFVFYRNIVPPPRRLLNSNYVIKRVA